MSQKSETAPTQLDTFGRVTAWLSLLLPAGGGICIYASCVYAQRGKFGNASTLLAGILMFMSIAAIFQFVAILRGKHVVGCLGMLAQPLLLIGVVIAGWVYLSEQQRWAVIRADDEELADQIEHARIDQKEKEALERKRAAARAADALPKVDLPEVAHGTRLVEQQRIKIAREIVYQIAYAHDAQRIFALIGEKSRKAERIVVYDTSDGSYLESMWPEHSFFDMDLSPDEKTLYATDFNGLGPSANPLLHHLHRFDTASGAIAKTRAIGFTGQIKAVDANHFLNLGGGQPGSLTLLHWPREKEECAVVATQFIGDAKLMAYDPRRYRAYLLDQSGDDLSLSAWHVLNGRFEQAGKQQVLAPGFTRGDRLVLSVDGKHLFYAGRRIDTEEKTETKTPEQGIMASGADIAANGVTYFDISTGRGHGGFHCEACAFSRDGRYLATAYNGEFIIYQVEER